MRIRQASRGNPFYALEIARLAESSVDSFTTELIADRAWRTHDQAELAIVEWVGWFNHQRLRSSLGDNPPTEYEHQWALAQLPTAEPRTQAAILA